MNAPGPADGSAPPPAASTGASSPSRRRLLAAAGGALGGLALGALLPSGVRAAPPGRDAHAVRRVAPGDSIQAAVDAAPSGGVVLVEPGFYRETVEITKPLTLRGVGGYAATVLEADPSRFRWASLPKEDYLVGAINVRWTRDVVISGFTVRGALEGVWVSASQRVLVVDCMSCAHESSGYYFWGSQACTLLRCEGSDCAVGVYQGGSLDIRIQQNDLHHNRGGRVAHLDDDLYPGIGVLIGNLSRGCRVIGNHLHDNADQGAGTSLGVSEIELGANRIEGNPVGVFAGERGLALRGNVVAGNRVGVDSAVAVDARRNWWGAADGPGGAGPGRGDAVPPPVAVRPWLERPPELPPAGPRLEPA